MNIKKIFLSFVVIFSAVQASDETQKISRNMNIKSMKLLLNNTIVEADKGCFIKQKKYSDSIRKVISTAFVDCLFGFNSFYNKNKDDIITFDGTDPRNYTIANWNCVVLYNYLKKIKDHFMRGDFVNTEDDPIYIVCDSLNIQGDYSAYVEDNIININGDSINIEGNFFNDYILFDEVYTLLLNNFKSLKINNLKEKLQKAVSDIYEYSKALNLLSIFEACLGDIEVFKRLVKVFVDYFSNKGEFYDKDNVKIKQCAYNKLYVYNDVVILHPDKNPNDYDINDWLHLCMYNFCNAMKYRLDKGEKLYNKAYILFENVQFNLKNYFCKHFQCNLREVEEIFRDYGHALKMILHVFSNINDITSIMDKYDEQNTIDNIFYKVYFGFMMQSEKLQYNNEVGGKLFTNRKDHDNYIYLDVQGNTYTVDKLWAFFGSHYVPNGYIDDDKFNAKKHTINGSVFQYGTPEEFECKPMENQKIYDEQWLFTTSKKEVYDDNNLRYQIEEELGRILSD